MSEKKIDLKAIGQRIRTARIDNGMSQEDLAYEAGIAVSNISDIELGKKDIRLSSFVHIIEALKISADEILRANVPEVNAIYQKEFAALLADCSTTEMETIINLVKNVKTSLRSGNN